MMTTTLKRMITRLETCIADLERGAKSSEEKEALDYIWKAHGLLAREYDKRDKKKDCDE